MPTIPLHSSACTADASHQVRSPGGYEWWYFDAEDPQHDRQVVVVFFDGFCFDPRYARRYSRYRRRPTRNAPPLPAKYPAVYVAMHQGGRLIARVLSRGAADTLNASSQQTGVSLGSGGFVCDGSALRLSVCHDSIQAQLIFRPRWPSAGAERSFAGGQHHWVIADPSCDVKGEIQLPRSAAPLAFRGRGYHDHRYGFSPPAAAARRWLFGRVILDQTTIAFQIVGDSSIALEADNRGYRERQPISVAARFSAWTRLGLAFPAAIHGPGVELVEPGIIHDSAIHARLLYRALIDGNTAGTALCHLIHPGRSGWPIVGQLIERQMSRPTSRR